MEAQEDDWVRANAFREQWKLVGGDALAAVERVGASGWYVLGAEVRAFEKALAKYVGAAHVVGCASGLDAIELALRALELPRGARVVTTPLSAFATTLAIVRAGGVPVFVDVDESGCLDLNAAELEIERSGARWMVPVNLYGAAIDAARLAELRTRYDLFIVEDCAQSIGAESHGRAVGHVGQAAALSFYPTKNLGAFGDAGAVWTSSSKMAEVLGQLRDYGQVEKYRHALLGMNSRLDEVHAAILRDALLPNLDRWLERRRTIAARYRAGIQNTAIAIVPEPAGSRSACHLFPVLVATPDALISHLKREHIESGRHYPFLISEQPALTQVPYEVASPLSVALRFARNEVSLPINPLLTDEAVERVIVACNSFRL